MEVKDFVKIYDDVLPLKTLSSLLKVINTLNFEQALVGGGENSRLDTKIRKTECYHISQLHSKSLTDIHWAALLKHAFTNILEEYKKELNLQDIFFNIVDIGILKYKKSFHYTWHTDNSPSNPRTLSLIMILNNDYKGGELCFKNVDNSGEKEIEIIPNRLVVWPSNFMYPHMVKPVKEGTRYTIVAWAQ